MADIVCPSGWLLAQDEMDGRYVPYFVKVRDKDIIYDVDNIPIELTRLSKQGTDIVYNYPAYEIVYTFENWRVRIKSDYTYEATKNIDIHTNGTLKNINQIDVNVKLPIITKNNNNINITFIKKCNAMDMMTANINLTVDTLEKINNVTLNMFSTRGFRSDFSTNPIYDNQFIQVCVKGDISK